MGAAHRNKKQGLVRAAATEGYFYTLSPEAVRRNEKDSQRARPQHLLQLLQINSAPAKLTVTPDSPAGNSHALSMETDARRLLGESIAEM